MTDLDNGLLHQPLQTQLKAAHQMRARHVSGLIQGLWTSLTGTKPSSDNAPTSTVKSAA